MKLYNVLIECEFAVFADNMQEAQDLAKSEMGISGFTINSYCSDVENLDDIPQGWGLSDVPFSADRSNSKTIQDYLEEITK